MKLYMRQHVFTIGDRFNVWDEDGHDRWFVEQELLTWGKILRVYDLSGREAVYIHQVIPSLFPRYQVEVYGRPITEIVKDLSYFRPRCTIEELGWEVLGSLGGQDYEITHHSTVVAACRPQQNAEGDDVLALEFYDRSTDLVALGVILAINCVLAPQESKRP